MLCKSNKDSHGATYAAWKDFNRLLLPNDCLTKEVREYLTNYTLKLSLGMKPSQAQVIVTRNGSTKQKIL